MHAHKHTIVRVEQGAQGTNGGVGGEFAHLLHHRQEFVALEKETDTAARLDNPWTDATKSCKVGHRDGIGGTVERIVAAEIVLADGGSIGAVAIEREGASTRRDAHLAQLAFELRFNLGGCHFTASLQEKVIGFKHAVGLSIGPRALQVAGRNGAGTAQEGSEHTGEGGNGSACAASVGACGGSSALSAKRRSAAGAEQKRAKERGHDG